jgi:hypothetical protein
MSNTLRTHEGVFYDFIKSLVFICYRYRRVHRAEIVETAPLSQFPVQGSHDEGLRIRSPGWRRFNSAQFEIIVQDVLNTLYLHLV